MSDFTTKQLPDRHDVMAPDGSEVRILVGTGKGSMAHFRLQPGQTTVAVAHRTVDEVWYVTAGSGEIWRRQGGREEITSLKSGTSLSIPLGTHFQFRAAAAEGLDIVGVTMPPWPGENEAYPVKGKW